MGTDISALNCLNTGSDNRIVTFNTKLERETFIQEILRPTRNYLDEKMGKYKSQLDRKHDPMKNLKNIELNVLSQKIVVSFQVVVKKVAP